MSGSAGIWYSQGSSERLVGKDSKVPDGENKLVCCYSVSKVRGPEKGGDLIKDRLQKDYSHGGL